MNITAPPVDALTTVPIPSKDRQSPTTMRPVTPTVAVQSTVQGELYKTYELMNIGQYNTVHPIWRTQTVCE